jgi:hypothetical protein
MRKHPLIALIAFTFVAASMFIGAAGVSSINNSVPVRATSHLKGGSLRQSVSALALRRSSRQWSRTRSTCHSGRALLATV